MKAASRKPQRFGDSDSAHLRSDAEAVAARGARRFGALLIIVLAAMVVAMLVWTRFSYVDDIARGDARVVATGPNTIVLALNAGVVKAILMTEGDTVAAGQPLLRIEASLSKAAIDQKRAPLYALMARAARLAAEAEGKEEIAFPDEVRRNAPHATELEMATFRDRLRLQKDQLATLAQLAAQKEQQLREAQSTLTRLESRLRLNRAAESGICGAYRDGSASFAECQTAQSVSIDTAGQVENVRRGLPRVEAALREAQQKAVEKRGRSRADARAELNETEARIAALRAQIQKETETPVLAELRAPVRGIVKKIGAAVGGTVKAGDALIEIVPADDTLLVDVRIKPADIAFVRIDQPATVRIAAYDDAIFGTLRGKVVEIGSDAIDDEKGRGVRAPHYRVRVRTERSYFERDKRVLPIVPGMSAQVEIRTGRRTLLDRIADPLRRLFSSVWRSGKRRNRRAARPLSSLCADAACSGRS